MVVVGIAGEVRVTRERESKEGQRLRAQFKKEIHSNNFSSNHMRGGKSVGPTHF